VDGKPLIIMPPQENVYATLTFEPVTWKLHTSYLVDGLIPSAEAT